MNKAISTCIIAGMMLLLFFSLQPPLVGQHIDSLKQKLSRLQNGQTVLPDSAKARLFYQRAYELRYSQTDSALVYSRKALQLSEKVGLQTLQADCYRNMGRIFYYTGEYDRSLQNFKNARDLYRLTGNEQGLAGIINSEALIYAALGEESKALAHFQNALQMAEKAGDERLSTRIYYNMGISHKDLNSTDRARRYFEKSLALSEKQGDSVMIARNYCFLAEIYTEQGDTDQAEPLYLKALEFLDNHNSWDLAFAHAGLAKMYGKAKQFDKALEHGKTGYQAARMIDAKWELQRVTKILADIYAQIKDFENAYRYQKDHSQWHEAVYNKTREQNLARLELARQEVQLAQLQIENEQQQSDILQTRFIIILLIMAVTFVGVLSYLLYRNAAKMKKLNDELKIKNNFIEEAGNALESKNEELKTLNDTKNKILSVISHDARGPLASLRSLLDYAVEDDLPQDELKFLLKNVDKNLEETSLMFDNMLRWAQSQFKDFTPHPKTLEVCQIIEEVMEDCANYYEQKNIEVRNSIGKQTKVYADRDMVEIVFRNLLSNAIKFCEQGDRITFKEKVKKDTVEIMVIDTGIGISEEQIKLVMSEKNFTRRGTENETGSGFGLTICRDFVEMNNGHLSITGEPDVGTTVTVELPKPNEKPDKRKRQITKRELMDRESDD